MTIDCKMSNIYTDIKRSIIDMCIRINQWVWLRVSPMSSEINDAMKNRTGSEHECARPKGNTLINHVGILGGTRTVHKIVSC